MGWEQERTAIIRIYFQDDDLATGRVEIPLPVALVDQAPSFAQNMIAVLLPLTNCVAVRYSISITVHDDTASTSGSAQAADVGAFIFATENTDERYIMCIPGIKEARLTVSGDFPGIAINASDSNVQAFVNAMINGIGGVTPITPWGADVTSLNVAYKQIRPQNLNRY